MKLEDNSLSKAKKEIKMKIHFHDCHTVTPCHCRKSQKKHWLQVVHNLIDSAWGGEHICQWKWKVCCIGHNMKCHDCVSYRSYLYYFQLILSFISVRSHFLLFCRFFSLIAIHCCCFTLLLRYFHCNFEFFLCLDYWL